MYRDAAVAKGLEGLWTGAIQKTFGVRQKGREERLWPAKSKQDEGEQSEGVEPL